MVRWSVGWGRAFTAAVSACWVSGSAFAQQSNPRILELPPGAAVEYHSTVSDHGATHGGDQLHGVRDLTPAHLPPEACLDCEPGHEEHHAHVESGLYGYADYLFWKPRRRGLDYLLVDPVADLAPQGSIQSVQPEARSGFRVGVGHRLESGWEVGTSYTFLRGGDGVSVGAAPPGGLLVPQMTRPGLIDSVARASADYDLGYDVWDAEFAHRVALTESFRLRFSGGVQYASIDQEIRSFYDGINANGAVAFRRHDFSGAGPYVGYDGDWQLPAGFSVYGGARAGLTFGEVTTGYSETNNNGATVNANISEEYSTVIPMMRVGLGVGWNRGKFGVRAGYEVVNWFDLSEEPYSYDDISRGKIGYRPADLSLEGFVVRVGWDY